jgi:nucleotide-binding universal stress UspA family protein
MKPLRHILVLTDFEEPATRALDMALTIAERFDARVTVMHVCAIPNSPYGSALFWPVEDLSREATKQLKAVVEGAQRRYPSVDMLLSQGDPRDEALAALSGKGDPFQLVVIGTHGRRGLARALLGSVAEAIVRSSPVPVLTVSTEKKS